MVQGDTRIGVLPRWGPAEVEIEPRAAGKALAIAVDRESIRYSIPRFCIFMWKGAQVQGGGSGRENAFCTFPRSD